MPSTIAKEISGREPGQEAAGKALKAKNVSSIETAYRDCILLVSKGPGALLSTAIFSRDRLHRYFLTRSWNLKLPTLCFVGQNPSRATHDVNDMTITKEMGFARRLGFGSILKVNLASLVATKPEVLLKAPLPIAPMNLPMVEAAISMADTVVAAWGELTGRFLRLLSPSIKHVKGLGPLQCLGRTKKGSPRHPCRMGYVDQLFDWA